MTAPEPKTKLQLGIDYIAKHPGARTDALAKAMSCERRKVGVLLQPAVTAGLLITCQVTRPGQQPCNEYRLGAASPEGESVDWKTFRISNREAKPLKAAPPHPPRVHETQQAGTKDQRENVEQTEAGSRANNPSSSDLDQPVGQALPPSKGATVIETPAACVMAAESMIPPMLEPAASDVTLSSGEELTLSLCNSGELMIHAGATRLNLSPAAVRELGQFLIDTEPAWS